MTSFLFNYEKVPFDEAIYRKVSVSKFREKMEPGTYCSMSMLTMWMPLTIRRFKWDQQKDIDNEIKKLKARIAELEAALETEHHTRVKAERCSDVKGNPYKHSPANAMNYIDAIKHVNAPVDIHPLLVKENTEK